MFDEHVLAPNEALALYARARPYDVRSGIIWGRLPSMSSAGRHQCLIYDGPASRMLPAIVATIRQHLAGRMRCMYLNSPAMVAGFRSQLYAAGTDVEREIARGSLILGSDDSHLVDGRFDASRMIDMLDAAVRAALADGYGGLFATGDMTWEFGSETELSKLLDYEWRLERLFDKQPALSGICQYHRDLLPAEAMREGLVSHPSLFVNEAISRANSHYVPARSPDERRAAVSAVLDAPLAELLAATS